MQIIVISLTIEVIKVQKNESEIWDVKRTELRRYVYVRYAGTLQLSETTNARNEDVVGG